MTKFAAYNSTLAYNTLIVCIDARARQSCLNFRNKGDSHASFSVSGKRNMAVCSSSLLWLYVLVLIWLYVLVIFEKLS